jgi:hypothetical protein
MKKFWVFFPNERKKGRKGESLRSKPQLLQIHPFAVSAIHLIDCNHFFKLYRVVFVILLALLPLRAQYDSSAVQNAVYNRPFIAIGETATAVGGYLEGTTNYFQEDGVSEGFFMEMRRFNIFLYSTIIPRVRFLAELEFEHGTEEIALETAQVDFELNPALVLRGGVLLVPIGAFNLNHDSPKWEFVERPLVATGIIPSTLSDIGFGFNGKIFRKKLIFTYDAYLVNGLDDRIILNETGRTFLQSGKNPGRFAEDNNGSPAFTGRVAFRQRDIGELGLSYYGGYYNSYKMEGEQVEKKRAVQIFAIDFNAVVRKAVFNGEFAFNSIDVPEDISEIYGRKQWGGYAEVVYPLLRKKMLGFENAVINAGLRAERIDYNLGEFSSTGKNIYDEVNALAIALSFRPSASTVLRANYRHHWIRDFAGNPRIKSAGFQFGIATYF